MKKLILSATFALALSLGIGPAQAGGGSFYEVSAADLAGRPGTIVRLEALPPPRGAAAAYRMLYRSRAHDGRPIVVSGIAAIPVRRPGVGGRPIVSWAHGTTGIAARCAPSIGADVFGRIAGFPDLMAFGAIVVATDYHGLGAPSRAAYLVAASEAHTVIDAARAARTLPGAEAGRDYVAWGWSEGAHAALAVADIAGRYAPDLTLVGVAAASPPTDLGALLRDDIATPAGQVLAAYAVSSWSQVYGVPRDTAVVAAAEPTVASIAGMCSLSVLDDVGLGLTAVTDVAGGLLKLDAAELPPWQDLIRLNSLTSVPRTVPLFVAQGLRDEIISPATTRTFVRTVCRGGGRVHYVEYPAADHGETRRRSAAAAVAWIVSRLGHRPAPSDCERIGTAPAAASGPSRGSAGPPALRQPGAPAPARTEVDVA
jgi:hypothetical protein